MARHNDNSPVEQTCPLINRVIGYLEGIEGQDGKELQFILDTLEEIREANSRLREWGNDQFKEREEWQDEAERKDDTIEDLKEEIKDLGERIEELKDEIEELEETIEEKDSIIEGLLRELA